MADYPVLLRLARRSIGRNRLRSALVVALIALPVAAGSFAAAANRTARIADDGYLNGIIGQAEISYTGPANADLEAVLAEIETASPGSEISTYLIFREQACFRCELFITSLDLEDALVGGIVDLHDGSPPRRSGEAAISSELIDDLNLEIGDRSGLPGLEGRWTIVGEVRRPTQRDAEAIVLTESDLLSNLDSEQVTRTILVEAGRNDALLPGGFVTEQSMFQVRSRRRTSLDEFKGRIDLDRPGQLSTAVSATLMIEIAFVAAAAFAVGTRRRIVEFGQLATVGADTGQIRRLVLAEALTLGLLGAVTGAIAGIAGAGFAASQGWLDFTTTGWVDGLSWSARDLLGPALIGLAAAVVAAWLPARRVSRIPVVSALAGRVPTARLARWIAPAGGVAISLGTLLVVAAVSAPESNDGLSAVIVLGVVLMFLGTAACAAPILSIAGRIADRLPAVFRLVVRNSSRQQVRSGATVAALIVVAAIPVIVSTAAVSNPPTRCCPPLDPRYVVLIGDLGDDPIPSGRSIAITPEIAAKLRDPEIREKLQTGIDETIAEQLSIPGAVSVPILDQWLSIEERTYRVGLGRLGVASPAVMDALKFTPEARFAISNGELVVTNSTVEGAYVISALQRYGYATGRFPDPASTEAVAAQVDIDADGWSLPIGYLSKEEAGSRGFSQNHANRLYVGTSPIDADERVAIYEAIGTEIGSILRPGVAPLPVESLGTELRFGSEDSGLTPRQVANRVILGAAGIGFLIALVSSALSAVELDRELGTMVASGAPPAIRRRFLAIQTWYHVLVAALLGTPLGLLLYWAVAQTDSVNTTEASWSTYGAVIVLTPAAVGLAIGLIFRSGRPIVSRRLS